LLIEPCIINLMFSGYLSMLSDINGLGPGAWQFEPGMLFDAETKWWGNGGLRNVLHNGLDLRYFKQGSGKMVTLGCESLVPVAGEGVILNIAKDFLGFSIFVSHGDDGRGRTLVSAYGHIVPEEGVAPGACVPGGHIIGSLAEYEGMPAPPHLHLSVFTLPGGLHETNWGSIEQDAVFLDPLDSFADS